VAGVLLGVGCGGTEPDHHRACTARVSEPIYSGDPDSGSAGLSPRQSWAIGAIESDLGTLYCTGVVIDSRWVLSAAHCAAGDGIRLRLAAEGAPTLVVSLGRAFVHPTLDLALIEVLAPEELESASVRPLAVRTAPLEDAVTSGTPAVLAGVGVTEKGERGKLLFVEEAIVAIDATSITVDGRGSTGACTGDSGGPLLQRSLNGEAAEILGILSKGEANCRGRDVYVRVDGQSAWFNEIQHRLHGQVSDCVCRRALDSERAVGQKWRLLKAAAGLGGNLQLPRHSRWPSLSRLETTWLADGVLASPWWRLL
jgi:hypothetical protein